MATHRLQRVQWQTSFDQVSRGLGGQHAEIKTAGLGIGAQIHQEWALLYGLGSRRDVDYFWRDECGTDAAVVLRQSAGSLLFGGIVGFPVNCSTIGRGLGHAWVPAHHSH